MTFNNKSIISHTIYVRLEHAIKCSYKNCCCCGVYVYVLRWFNAKMRLLRKGQSFKSICVCVCVLLAQSNYSRAQRDMYTTRARVVLDAKWPAALGVQNLRLLTSNVTSILSHPSLSRRFKIVRERANDSHAQLPKSAMFQFPLHTHTAVAHLRAIKHGERL